MDDPTTYRKYAEECKRLAKSMSPADRKTILEIAEAWLKCAEKAEAKTSGGDAKPDAKPEQTDGDLA